MIVFSMQAEKLTWSLRKKILWSTCEFFSCLFDLQNLWNVSLRDDLRRRENSDFDLRYLRI